MKSLRYLQQTEKAKIEHDLVLTRMGNLALRDDNLLARGFLYTLTDPNVIAVINEGLIASPGAGLSVDLTVPAFALQKVTDNAGSNEVKLIADDNGGSSFNVVLDPADLSNDRVDIIEATILTRSEFTDTNVSIVDPTTKVISSTTRDRDFELYLSLQKKTGTPAAIPAPPNYTVATAGIVLGSVDIASTTNDLSTTYILNLGIGIDSEFVEIDLRGATPAATTSTEIVNNINAAGFGTIAALNGNFLEITAVGTGENSIVKIKQPLNSANDAYTTVLGFPETPGYYDIYQGANAWFKVAEIFVPSGVSSLTATNVRTRLEKDTDWLDDEETIINGVSLDEHRTINPIDHPDGSIFANHLDPSVLNVVSSKVTQYRGITEYLYAESQIYDETVGRVHVTDVELTKVDGAVQDNVLDADQEYPLRRVDQREENFSGGSGYAVPVSLSEAASDRREFTVGDPVDDGTNFYTVQDYAGNHSRIGIYISNGSSTTGFTDLRVTLHDPGNNVEGQVDIPIADLQTVGTGWVYADLTASLTVNTTYHYHFEMIGETSPTAPVLGNASGAGADTIAFRSMYLSSGGKYGSIDEDDVFIATQANIIRNSKILKFLDDTTNNYDVVELTSTKILLIYEDVTASNIGRAVVADISGTVPTFGSPVTFAGNTTGEMQVVALSENTAFVVYRDINNSGYGTGIVLNISGNVITTGSASVFASNNTTDIAAAVIASNKIFVGYVNADSTDDGVAIIAEIEDTTITYGSPVTFNTDETSNVQISTIDIDKVVVTWENFDSVDNEGIAVIATITNLTPAFGSTVLIDSGNDPIEIDVTTINSNTFIVGYSDTNNSNYATVRIGTINGTTITFVPKYEFHNHVNTNTQCIRINETQIAIIYNDTTNSSLPTMALIGISGVSVISILIDTFSDVVTNATLATALLANSKIVMICNDNGDSSKGKITIPETTYIGKVREVDTDTIVSPGDGFAGLSNGSNYDYIPVDFSDEIFWSNWRYEDYIGVDLATGRVKLPPSLSIRNVSAQYNVTEGITEQDAKNYLRHRIPASIENSITFLEDEFRVKEIYEAELDLSSTVYVTTLDNSSAIIFPNTGTPKITFEFKTRNPGQISNRNIVFEMLYAMTTAASGVVKLDMTMRVNGILQTSRTETILVSDNISRSKILTSLLYLDASDFNERDQVVIELTRDNGVGSNHSGEFGLFNLGVV